MATLIWFRMNYFIREQMFQSPKSIYRQCVQAHSIFINSLQSLSITRSRVTSNLSYWIAPPLNWIKENWDVVIKVDHSKIGIRVIIYNCHGMVLASMRQPLT